MFSRNSGRFSVHHANMRDGGSGISEQSNNFLPQMGKIGTNALTIK
jgi:hypothetical protein